MLRAQAIAVFVAKQNFLANPATVKQNYAII